ncbi:putative late blight resistance protein homolog R1A-3 isoform X3 [Lycium barbarum]|uniref:putative late blight resistance protein homolog R1A-3 isoform X3 n=1 Tax=Lycium barbarum TaxID=112863 RepID=UPI00293F69E5|nr:putative late blight resistance protein homolog R1A-3 isoform X3 [Lycium barbarum]
MADAVVNFLVENLFQLLSENIELIRGVDDDFKDLLEEVQRLKAFLEDAAKYHSESSQWDQLVKDIQKTVHKAEDAIDKFLVQAKLHRDKNKLERIFDKVGHSASVRALAAEIKSIHEKVRKLRENNQQAFQPRPVLELPRRGSPEQGPSLEDAEVVGFDEEANIVIKRLVEGPAECLDIVPVVGMPGLGKTTLARKIYNDSRLSYEFFSVSWVFVGQTYNIKDIFLNILKFFTKRIEEHQGEDVDKLANKISGFMNKGGRCLIVLDDVWAEDVIDAVKRVFPENKKGHRIMMTTREGNVAKYANKDPHDLKFLTEGESFELLVKRVFGKESCPVDLVGPGTSIARKCSGVPLAVVVIAGALRGRPNRNDWQRVDRNVVEHLINKDDPKSCLKFVGMSYDRLPQEMQTCFLYSSVFPRGFDIPSCKLIRLWIAEGLIKSQQTYTLEEIAEFYLNDLVNRNLVILMKKKSDGQIKTCRLHDMLHEFCRKEAVNKWIFQEICTTADNAIPSISDSDACRRLCIQPSILDKFLLNNPLAEHVRSFHCFSSEQKLIELSPNDIKLIHKAFPLLRVLDVESLKFIFSKDFNQLYHLRYVAISGDFKVLPPTFGKFWNLQTLVLNTSTSEATIEVKADIWNLLQLRHLHTNIPAKLPAPSTTRGRPSCLQTLSMVAPESCKKDVLAKACQLKKLSIRGQMAAFLDTYKGGISNLEELKCLEHLKLLNDVLYMNKPVHLPAAFFRLVRTVKKLTLANTRFSWSDANRLAQLESLEVLKLKENAFLGESWEPEIGGFSTLQVLRIERSELESWVASNLNFPILRHLILISCDKLKAVPLELADIPNFQEMRLDNTSKSAVKSAKEIESKKLKGENLDIELDGSWGSWTNSWSIRNGVTAFHVFAVQSSDKIVPIKKTCLFKHCDFEISLAFR